MTDIGDDVKIVGEKLVENCDLTSELTNTGNFWYRAAMTVRENTTAVFTQREVDYMNAKWREAERKYFGSLVIETVATGDMAQNSYKLPHLKQEIESAKEQQEYEAKKSAEKQRIKDEFDLRKYKENLTNKEEAERYDRERRYAMSIQGSSLGNYNPALNQRR